MNSLISIIVPIYKVEKYIRKCLDSIVNQTYTNLEIILVDDGSPDSCGQICDQYAQKDSRIKVIHKLNGGLSDARNVGLDAMTGDYVTCIDSDDYISLDYVEKLYKAIIDTNSDISVCNFYFNYEKSLKLIPAFKFDTDKIVLDRNDALKTLLYQNNMETGAWGKLYSCRLFDGVRYPVGRLFEDIPTTYKLYLKATKVVSISDSLYYYLIRDSSIMGQSFTPKKMDAVYMAKDMLDGIEAINDSELLLAAKCRYVSMCFNTLFQTPRKSTEENYIFSEILKYRKDVLADSSARRKAKIALYLSYLGLSMLRFVYSINK